AGLHAQIATEAGTFDIADVFDAVSSKLIRRHPHVFGDVVADDPEAVLRTWEAVKATEPGKADRGQRDPYDKLPSTMPVSARINLVEQPDGSTLTKEEISTLATEIVERTLRLVRANADSEAALELAYRILRD
ncbi:MAG TPA: MazG nucleotide pyrophosphohydrolase domain-containing protein, partial [Thermomicrobiales bacterium]|nr:MazG nucleotide pyrophosphohydrolase domain-containing protein [Thermomicrobiales bacterium]